MTAKINQFINIDDPPTGIRLSEQDLEFWNNNPPELIVLATGSIRKALMFIALTNDFSFTLMDSEGEKITIKTPEDLQNYFNNHVSNGDGSLEAEVYLCHLHGVKVVACPSNGETKSNEDPYSEAQNKVNDLYEKYKNKKALIIGIDTVDKPDNAKSPLGKPMNESDFPKRDEEISNEDYEQIVTNFLAEFKARFYYVSECLEHTNAVAILYTLHNLIIESENNLLKLIIQVNKEKLEQAVLHPDMGGGGVSQQLVDWEGNLLRYFDQFTSGLLLELNPREETLKMILFCQISGMPYAIIELIRASWEEVSANKS